jgi:hypothetical protein
VIYRSPRFPGGGSKHFDLDEAVRAIRSTRCAMLFSPSTTAVELVIAAADMVVAVFRPGALNRSEHLADGFSALSAILSDSDLAFGNRVCRRKREPWISRRWREELWQRGSVAHPGKRKPSGATAFGKHIHRRILRGPRTTPQSVSSVLWRSYAVGRKRSESRWKRRS